jgi:hypothetical protein
LEETVAPVIEGIVHLDQRFRLLSRFVVMNAHQGNPVERVAYVIRPVLIDQLLLNVEPLDRKGQLQFSPAGRMLRRRVLDVEHLSSNFV